MAETARRLRSEETRHNLRIVAAVAAASAGAGAAFTWIAYHTSPLQGAVTGTIIGALWMSFQLFAARPLQRLPFGIALLLRAIGFTALILVGLNTGIFLFGTRENPHSLDPASLRFYWTVSDWPIDVMFSFAVGGVMTFLVTVNLLIGPGVLTAFLLGRYYRPRAEERVFLFADLVGSTALAERLGDLRFHALLQRIVADLSDPIRASRGRIDRYIGDAVVVTWPLREGVAEARALRCAVLMQERLAAEAPAYRRGFGAAPAIRIGLHAGPVVAGEIGVFKKEILFLGDTVNMAARVAEACKTFGRPLLLTRELRDLLDLPPGWRAESLGPFQARGRARPTELFTVVRSG